MNASLLRKKTEYNKSNRDMFSPVFLRAWRNGEVKDRDCWHLINRVKWHLVLKYKDSRSVLWWFKHDYLLLVYCFTAGYRPAISIRYLLGSVVKDMMNRTILLVWWILFYNILFSAFVNMDLLGFLGVLHFFFKPCNYSFLHFCMGWDSRFAVWSWLPD